MLIVAGWYVGWFLMPILCIVLCLNLVSILKKVDHCRTGFSKYVLRLLLADHAVREDKLNSDWRINGKLNRFTTKL